MQFFAKPKLNSVILNRANKPSAAVLFFILIFIGNSVSAISLEAQRKDYLLAKKALDTKQYKTFGKIANTLKEYPLYPYLRYEHLRKRLWKAKDQEVIVYCSVGYRSERIGEKLQKAGYTNVKNLYGGIFSWKNEGNEVVRDADIPTDSVHTYNKSWGKWLLKGIEVY